MKKSWRPSKLELRTQEFARSKASKQLLHVPYDEFAKAARRYVRWEAFALWIRAVLRVEEEVPTVAHEALHEQCPSFLKHEVPILEPTRVSRRLDEWIHGRLFERARRERWFDAILFYSVRDPKLKYAYAYWEQCEREWLDKRPRRYPAFEAWFQSACNCTLFPVNANRLARSVESYLDWLSLAHWVEPLLENDVPLPSHLGEDLKRKGGRFREVARRLEPQEQRTIVTKFHLVSWIENRYFLEAQEGRWLEFVRSHAQNHPRYARISKYASRWRAQRPQERPRVYPLFTDWCHDANNFVERFPQ